jgi:hypothetical protein
MFCICFVRMQNRSYYWDNRTADNTAEGQVSLSTNLKLIIHEEQLTEPVIKEVEKTMEVEWVSHRSQ